MVLLKVRGAWFKLIAIMCRVLPTVLEGQLSKLCPTVLGLLEEGDPVVASVIWDAALHIVVAFKAFIIIFNSLRKSSLLYTCKMTSYFLGMVETLQCAESCFTQNFFNVI